MNRFVVICFLIIAVAGIVYLLLIPKQFSTAHPLNLQPDKCFGYSFVKDTDFSSELVSYAHCIGYVHYGGDFLPI